MYTIFIFDLEAILQFRLISHTSIYSPLSAGASKEVRSLRCKYCCWFSETSKIETYFKIIDMFINMFKNKYVRPSIIGLVGGIVLDGAVAGYCQDTIR